MIDLFAVGALVVARLKTDAEGASVRALLGAGAQGVIHADDLSRDTLPARPLLALRAGPVPQLNRIVHAPIFTWWIYDDLEQRYARIDALARPITLAYAARKLALSSGGVIGSVEVGQLSAQQPDPALGLVCRSIKVILHTT